MDENPDNLFHTLNAIGQTDTVRINGPEGFGEFYNLLPVGVHNEIQSSMFIFDAHWNHRSPQLMAWEGRQTSGILELPYKAGTFKTLGGEIMPHYSDGAAILELGARMLVTASLLEERLTKEDIGIDEYRRLRTKCGEPVFEVFQQGTNYIDMNREKQNFGKMAEAAITAAETIVVQHFNYSHSTEIFRFLEDLRAVIQTHFITSTEVNETYESNGTL